MILIIIVKWAGPTPALLLVTLLTHLGTSCHKTLDTVSLEFYQNTRYSSESRVWSAVATLKTEPCF